ncbi:glycosyltransferase family 2 protein [Candidatus Pelagibacter sp.]|nr:glycosyltransferase family 2 protein [Candidatus Pelagibacter sp.]
MNIKISVIIPCFNEKDTILKTLKKVIQVDPPNKEIIIVDDCSTDGTLEEIKKIKDDSVKIYYHEKNFGKGRALKTALKNVTGDIVIIQDADSEYDPKEYSRLLKPFFETDADIVYGSRFLGGGDYVRLHFFWHFIANKMLTFATNIFTNLNMTDMETGYKLFKKNVIQSIELKENSFGIEPEITIKLAKKGYKFYEVPISYRGRSYEEGKKIGIKDAFRAIYCILKYKFFN